MARLQTEIVWRARKNPDFREGRPKKFTKAQLDHALSLLESGQSYKQVEKDTSISKSTLIREVRRRRDAL